MPSSMATDQLSDLLTQIKALDDTKAKLESSLAAVKAQRESLESLAVEEMKSLRVDGVRVAGRSWRVEDVLHLSVSKDRRDAVLEAARQAGIEDAITTVATPTLKAWLVEQAKAAGREAGASFADGTPFAGIVGEYVEQKLRHVAAGS